ncbi:MAG: molybdopterin-guanine dinucleotide biosynthesis protein B, partial [Candidatus Electrothrix sp. AR4]|nr:molybdopterin-guanine dinucleotide biosynthesis protein B [Candidatus Electrothrix sp. AR4]
MLPIITFIGWHDSGKTTLAVQVVRRLKERGYSVAVIKSTKETGLLPDQEGTDTGSYRLAGADAVTLIAPDQMVITCRNPKKNLFTLAHRFFADVDIVIGEGFKDAEKVAKIEVSRGGAPLRDLVSNVIAVATDRDVSGDHIFRLDESENIAAFLEQKFIAAHRAHRKNLGLTNNLQGRITMDSPF